MSSMTSPCGSAIGGIDAHTDTHDAALDERGRLLGTRTFPTTPEGNRALLAWLESFGSIAVIGVESTGSYAAGLVRFLRSREVAVVEVRGRAQDAEQIGIAEVRRRVRPTAARRARGH